MELNNLPMFALIRQRMNWLNQRQEVIAQNVANANTPDYPSQDLKPSNFKDVINKSRSNSSGVTLAVTRSNHIEGSGSKNASSFKVSDVRRPYETAPDGNQVVLEEQMIKMNETVTNHNLITQIYKKQLSMFRIVTKGG